MYQSQLLALAPGEFVFSRYSLAYFFFNIFFARMCLMRKSEKTKIVRPNISNEKCPPCGSFARACAFDRRASTKKENEKTIEIIHRNESNYSATDN